MNQLAKYTDQTYALMRIVTGLMFSFHGAQKIIGILAIPSLRWDHNSGLAGS
jgi:hypothetical protein